MPLSALLNRLQATRLARALQSGAPRQLTGQWRVQQPGRTWGVVPHQPGAPHALGRSQGLADVRAPPPVHTQLNDMRGKLRNTVA